MTAVLPACGARACGLCMSHASHTDAVADTVYSSLKYAPAAMPPNTQAASGHCNNREIMVTTNIFQTLAKVLQTNMFLKVGHVGSRVLVTPAGLCLKKGCTKRKA